MSAGYSCGLVCTLALCVTHSAAVAAVCGLCRFVSAVPLPFLPLFQVDEDLAKINVDDPRYLRDDQDGFANGVCTVSSARVLVRAALVLVCAITSCHMACHVMLHAVQPNAFCCR